VQVENLHPLRTTSGTEHVQVENLHPLWTTCTHFREPAPTSGNLHPLPKNSAAACGRLAG